MRVSTKRILSIGFAGLFLILALVVYASAIRPEMQKIGEKRSVSASKEKLFSSQESAVREVQKLISQFRQSIGNVQEVVSLALPRGENVTEALNQLQGILVVNQVQLTSFSIKPIAFSPNPQPLVKRLGTLVVNLSAQGAYEGLKGFLQSLETNVRVANVRTFSFSPVVEVGGRQGDVYTLSLAVEIYYQE